MGTSERGKALLRGTERSRACVFRSGIIDGDRGAFMVVVWRSGVAWPVLRVRDRAAGGHVGDVQIRHPDNGGVRSSSRGLARIWPKKLGKVRMQVKES